MSVLWTSAEAVAATGGRATRDWQATGVSIDTRMLVPGDLFVALRAARDGHDFVSEALEKGAAAALVDRVPEGLAGNAPLLVVNDTMTAIADMARAARARSRAQIVGVTGSVGKTSTKEMLRTALTGQGQIHAADRSFNNHWGVPVTLMRLPRRADFAVIEIGMNHPGEIGPLARLARPHVAMITSVAPAHLEAFDDLAGIAREKAAIFEGLEPGGTAVINGDLAVASLLRAAAQRAGARVVSFGEGHGNHHRLTEVALSVDSTVGRGRAWRTPFLIKIATPGRHFAVNATGVLAAVHALGGDRAQALCALADWTPPGGRGLRERLVLDVVEDDMTIDLIDDAFNANPASMAAALDVLIAARPLDGVGRVARGRRIAILGDMLELGSAETRLHAEIAAHPGLDHVAQVHCVGPCMRALWDALPEHRRGLWRSQAREMAAEARHLADAGDVVLVKGSKGSRVSLVVDAIRKLGQARPSADTQGVA